VPAQAADAWDGAAKPIAMAARPTPRGQVLKNVATRDIHTPTHSRLNTGLVWHTGMKICNNKRD
jgi:hypothetical protein